MSQKNPKIEKALQELREGKMLVISDKSDREDEGDVLMAASLIDSKKLNFMITHCKGLVCAPITSQLAKKLSLNLIWQNEQNNEENQKKKISTPKISMPKIATNFTVPIDHKTCSTGISADERALTLKTMADAKAKAEDFHRPGHIFPIIAHSDGLAARQGHTEMAIHLLREAKLPLVGVICEIIDANGTMARGEQLKKFSKKHKLLQLSIEEILAHFAV